MAREMVLNGLTLTVEESASATTHPPVLFIHGLFAGSWAFERYQRLFAEHGYKSYALNLRGHGASRPVPSVGRVSVDQYVIDALDAARVLGRPVVIGHSMGGLIAQKLAERDAALAIVLLCSAPGAGIPAVGGRLALRMVRYLPALLLSQPIVPRRKDADALILNRVPVAEREAIFRRFVPASGRAARELALGRVPVDVARVTCPVLSVAAGDDRMVPPRIAYRIAKLYDAPHREFAAMGHMLVTEPGWEQPAGHILRWLDAAIKLAAVPSLRDTQAGVGGRISG
jgi:pimeloyl-ACP methyl ester carboxylesterase